MPLYMDIHTVDSDDFTVEDVVKAHMQDLAIQERFGVTQIKYWVNEAAKTIFCLMEGPDKDACNMVHKESHGNTACNIIEVSDDEYDLYLGTGKDKDDLAYTNSGELDTGYRTVLLLNMADFTSRGDTYNDEIYQSIEKREGKVIVHPEDDIMVSFIHATNAILCAQDIYNILTVSGDNIEFNIAVASGRPVDEEGTDLFEQTKMKVRSFCSLGLVNNIYLDSDTKILSEKEHITEKFKGELFNIIQNDDAGFLFRLFEIMDNKSTDPEFKSNDLYPLLGQSKSQTYRKIKSLTGLAPNQFIQEQRLSKSLKKLKDSSTTISEIAFDTGFNSPTYFTRIFKKRFSITPTSYIQIS